MQYASNESIGDDQDGLHRNTSTVDKTFEDYIGVNFVIIMDQYIRYL
jgi:hypothetical protein